MLLQSCDDTDHRLIQVSKVPSKFKHIAIKVLVYRGVPQELISSTEAKLYLSAVVNSILQFSFVQGGFR